MVWTLDVIAAVVPAGVRQTVGKTVAIDGMWIARAIEPSASES